MSAEFHCVEDFDKNLYLEPWIKKLIWSGSRTVQMCNNFVVIRLFPRYKIKKTYACKTSSMNKIIKHCRFLLVSPVAKLVIKLFLFQKNVWPFIPEKLRPVGLKLKTKLLFDASNSVGIVWYIINFISSVIKHWSPNTLWIGLRVIYRVLNCISY